MIDLDLKVEGMKATERAIDRAVRKTIYSLTKKIKKELKEEASEKLDIKRPWVLQGFRSKVEQSASSAYRSTLWHRSGFMRKHEEGDNILAREGGEFIVPRNTPFKRFCDHVRTLIPQLDSNKHLRFILAGENIEPLSLNSKEDFLAQDFSDRRIEQLFVIEY